MALFAVVVFVPLVFPLLAGLDADVGEAVSGATVGSLGSSTSEMEGVPVDIIGDAEGLDVGEPLYNILIYRHEMFEY